MIHEPKIERFIAAFTDQSGGCRRQCDCGTIYYNSDGGWDWEEGELDELESNQNAIDCSFTIGTLSFGGKEYVETCDCWHASAMQMMAWVDSHSHCLARYINGEREAALKRAEAMALIIGHD